eukprot:m.235615 g.235615  ORF g.235615 m.235615 type:complete len:451 (+) comp18927_c0_seq11:3305-4657(+)
MGARRVISMPVMVVTMTMAMMVIGPKSCWAAAPYSVKAAHTTTTATTSTPQPLGFMRGAAMGMLPVIDCNGTCSKYRANTTAPIQDAIAILGDYGVNTIRLRLFIFPYPNNSYAGLESVKRMAKRAHAAGHNISLDIFYTQWFFGVPYGVQRRRPAPWRNLTFDALLDATYNYTRASVGALVAQGTPPATVQIGNEINCGIFFPDPDKPCSSGGEVCQCEDNWGNLARIIAAGSRGVRDAYPPANIIIQLGASKDLSHGGQWAHKFYTTIAAAGAPYDAFGLSFYQIWGARNVSDLCFIADAARALPDKKIYVIETGYPYKYGHRFQPGKVPGQVFPATPAGQLAWLRAVLYTVEHGLWGRGAGVSWWGTEYANPCSGDECAAFWDANYTGLPVLTDRGFRPSDPNNPPPHGVKCPPLDAEKDTRTAATNRAREQFGPSDRLRFLDGWWR